MQSCIRIVLSSSLLAAGCFRSNVPPAPETPPDAGAAHTAAPDAASPHDAASGHDADRAARTPAEQAVAAFERAFEAYCRCHDDATCDIWLDKFAGTSRACVVELLEADQRLAGCVGEGAADIRGCLESSCSGCSASLLTEDSVLTELAERYCPRAAAQAYGDAYRAAHLCLGP